MQKVVFLNTPPTPDMLHAVRARFDADVASISLLALDGARTVHFVSTPASPRIEFFEQPVPDMSNAVLVMQTAQPLVLSDTRLTRANPKCKMMEAENLLSYLAVPMALQGDSVGALEVFARQPRNWTAEDIEDMLYCAGKFQLSLEAGPAHPIAAARAL